MANALYELGREGFLAGEIDWSDGVIRAALVRGYSPNLTTHKFVSDVTGAGGTLDFISSPLTGKTVTLGVADADDVTYVAVSGAAVPYILVYQSSAPTGGADVADSAKRLIALYDSSSTGLSLPFTPTGGDVTVAWGNGSDRMFKL